MFKYWLTHRAPLSALLSITIITVLFMGFVSPYISINTENRNRLGVYEDSNIDFDIPQPTKEQLKEITNLPFVASSFGYYYTESLVDIGGKKVMIKILFSEDMKELDNTMYSPARLIKYTNENYENPIYIDYAFSKNNDIHLGDAITFNSIDFQVAKIYETNSYYDSAIFMPLVREQKDLIEEKSTSYSGAFLTVNNLSDADKYLESYKPLGRLKDRSLFNSDKEYQLHYEQWEKTSYSNEITSFASKQREISLKSTLPIWFGSIIVLIVMLFFNILIFNSNMEKGYFEAKKTKHNNSTFFTWTAIEELLVMTTVSIIEGVFITKKVPYYIPKSLYMESIITVFSTIICYVLVSYIINRILLRNLNDDETDH